MSTDLTAITEDLSDKGLLKRFLLVCILGNVIIWTAVLFSPETVGESFKLVFAISDKIGIGILGIPFGLAVFATYCLCRLKIPSVEENKHLKSDLMASFNYQTDLTRRWFVWHFLTVVGVLNVILLVFVNLYLTDQL